MRMFLLTFGLSLLALTTLLALWLTVAGPR